MVDAFVVNADANRRRHRDDNDDLGVGRAVREYLAALREVDAPTGKSDREVSQPVQPFPGVARMSFYGRFQSSPSLATISECSARNGRKPLVSGRLVNNYLIIH